MTLAGRLTDGHVQMFQNPSITTEKALSVACSVHICCRHAERHFLSVTLPDAMKMPWQCGSHGKSPTLSGFAAVFETVERVPEPACFRRGAVPAGGTGRAYTQPRDTGRYP